MLSSDQLALEMRPSRNEPGQKAGLEVHFLTGRSVLSDFHLHYALHRFQILPQEQQKILVFIM